MLVSLSTHRDTKQTVTEPSTLSTQLGCSLQLHEASFVNHFQLLQQHVFDGCVLVKFVVTPPNTPPPPLNFIECVYIEDA